jgi:hypothetical protein
MKNKALIEIIAYNVRSVEINQEGFCAIIKAGQNLTLV